MRWVIEWRIFSLWILDKTRKLYEKLIDQKIGQRIKNIKGWEGDKLPLLFKHFQHHEPPQMEASIKFVDPEKGRKFQNH